MEDPMEFAMDFAMEDPMEFAMEVAMEDPMEFAMELAMEVGLGNLKNGRQPRL